MRILLRHESSPSPGSTPAPALDLRLLAAELRRMGHEVDCDGGDTGRPYDVIHGFGAIPPAGDSVRVWTPAVTVTGTQGGPTPPTGRVAVLPAHPAIAGGAEWSLRPNQPTDCGAGDPDGFRRQHGLGPATPFLLLLGDGPEADACLTALTDLSLPVLWSRGTDNAAPHPDVHDSVTSIGPLQGVSLDAAITACSLAVDASEGLGSEAALRAAAARVPMLASARSHLGIGPATPLPREPEAIRAAVEHLLTGGAAIEESLRAQAIAVAAACSVRANAETCVSLYRGAIEAGEREARRRRSADRGPGVHFRGAMLGTSGFAIEGREWLSLLEDHGFAPSAEAASLGHLRERLRPDEAELLQRSTSRPRSVGGTTLHMMLVPHFAPDPRADRNLLITLFETDSLPTGYAERLNRADRVLVRCEYTRGAFVRGGVDPERLGVLRPPLDPRPFSPGPRAPRLGRPFRWLANFDWSLRKGHDLLLPAFGATFAAGEAELWLKTTPHPQRTRGELQRACEAMVARHANGRPAPRVRVIEELFAPEQMVDLYRQVDGLVCASRGEGWGRPVQEAMLMELPVVVPAAMSLETLVPDESVGFRVPARKVPVSAAAAEETPLFAGQNWYEVDPERLGARMREVFEHPAWAARRGRRARNHALALCRREPIAQELATLLS